jgi:predicted nucleic acid-binding protein
MSKLGVEDTIIREDCDFYFQFVTVEPDYAILRQAIETCTHRHQCKNINDIQHLYLAEKARCSTLVTYDRDFRKLEGLVNVVIEVL